MPSFIVADGFGSIQIAVESLTDEQAAAVWDAQKAHFLAHIRKRRAHAVVMREATRRHYK